MSKLAREIDEGLKRKHIEDFLKQEFEQDLPGRVARWLKARPHWIMPYNKDTKHFVAVSAECNKLFRDGYFYGSISLVQGVTEAIVRFLCQKNSWKPDNDFEKNVNKLTSRKFISGGLKETMLKIWKGRDVYHHLNPAVETERQKLEKLAEEKICLLTKLERDIFNVVVTDDGRIVAEKPKYWKTNQAESIKGS